MARRSYKRCESNLDACVFDYLVDDCQQRKAQTDGEIPPSPVSRLESAHPPIVDQLIAWRNPGGTRQYRNLILSP